ncbi:unnamed protein product, partial [Sphacelaria rigidula]
MSLTENTPCLLLYSTRTEHRRMWFIWPVPVGMATFCGAFLYQHFFYSLGLFLATTHPVRSFTVQPKFTGTVSSTTLARTSTAQQMMMGVTERNASKDLIEILPPREQLPHMGDEGLTVVSFNVLLPNGKDGWWIYKSYQPHVPEEHRTWPYRQALMKDYLLKMDADIVCIQEASAETFDADFGFMKEAGYDSVLHSKFRFRSATFFKTSKLELACEKHKDRVLITGFRTTARLSQRPVPISSPPADNNSPVPPTPSTMSPPADKQSEVENCDPTKKGSPVVEEPAGLSACATEKKDEEVLCHPGVQQDRPVVMMVNCHLTGGPVPERRMRQVFDALETVRKEAARVITPLGVGGGGGGGTGEDGVGSNAGKAAKTSVPVIVCGDFNSNGQSAVWELLTKGLLSASFREEGYPEVTITSKDKKHGFGPFADMYEEAYGPAPAWVGQQGLSTVGGKCPPPTFMVPLLEPHFWDDDGESMSPRLKVALSEVFHQFLPNSTLPPALGASERSTDSAESKPTASAATTMKLSSSATLLPREGVQAWLLKINRSLGRGSEFRAAEACMEQGSREGLSLEDFFSIYLAELRHGKFWGVAHDLHVCGVQLPEGMPWVGAHETCLDHIFYSKVS